MDSAMPLEGVEALEPPNHASMEQSPVVLLQEFSAKISEAPLYVLQQCEGEPHHPSFTMRVTVGKIVCTGQASTKKMAKQNAAMAALDILQRDVAMSVPQPDPPTVNEPPAPNLIGDLQELTVKKGWRPPRYSIAEESGLPHERVFTMSCQVEGFMETATGASKKIAKRGVAEKLLEKLRAVAGDDSPIPPANVVPGNNVGCTGASQYTDSRHLPKNEGGSWTL